MDLQNIANHVAGILQELNIPLEQQAGIKETPQRVARMYLEMFSGYNYVDGKDILCKNFIDEDDAPLRAYDQLITVHDISFDTFCEHHMAMFSGKVHIGYIPDKKVIGLSKLPRLVEIYSKRLQVQERFTQQILNDIVKYIEPRGAMVVVQASHSCVCARGVRNRSALTTTSAIHGVLDTSGAARMEFLAMIGGK